MKEETSSYWVNGFCTFFPIFFLRLQGLRPLNDVQNTALFTQFFWDERSGIMGKVIGVYMGAESLAIGKAENELTVP